MYFYIGYICWWVKLISEDSRWSRQKTWVRNTEKEEKENWLAMWIKRLKASTMYKRHKEDVCAILSHGIYLTNRPIWNLNFKIMNIFDEVIFNTFPFMWNSLTISTVTRDCGSSQKQGITFQAMIKSMLTSGRTGSHPGHLPSRADFAGSTSEVARKRTQSGTKMSGKLDFALKPFFF